MQACGSGDVHRGDELFASLLILNIAEQGATETMHRLAELVEKSKEQYMNPSERIDNQDESALKDLIRAAVAHNVG